MHPFIPALAAIVTIAAPAAAQLQAYAQNAERKATRIAYFDMAAQSSPGQFVIQYGAPQWKDEYEDQVDQLKGMRFRLGSDFWATLDTSMDLTIAGTKVPAGYYYLGMARTEDGDYRLVLHDANKLRPMRTDAFITSRLSGGIEVPMTHAKADSAAERLKIELSEERGQLGKASLLIQWGPHKLTAPIVADLSGGKPADASASGKPGEKSEKGGADQADPNKRDAGKDGRR